jgi:hypothetical protein
VALPRSIAAVSFRGASARDLERRIRDACEKRGHDHAEIRITTLHSLALRALKAHPVDPRVLDDWELRHIFDDEFGHSAGIGTVERLPARLADASGGVIPPKVSRRRGCRDGARPAHPLLQPLHGCLALASDDSRGSRCMQLAGYASKRVGLSPRLVLKHVRV